MRRSVVFIVLVLATAGWLAAPAARQSGASQRPAHPDFKPSPEQGPLPKSLLVVKRTDIK